MIVISGQVAAGKTTAGKMLGKRGFQYARISQAIRTRWDQTRGEKPPRSWYQEMGMKLHHDIGQWALCNETMSLIENRTSSFVIDGARWHDDVSFFRKNFGSRLIHIHLVAPDKVRKKRFAAREKDVSFEEADADEVEREVTTLSECADAVFNNDLDDPDKLEAFLTSVLERD